MGVTLIDVLADYADRAKAVNGRLYLTGISDRISEQVVYCSEGATRRAHAGHNSRGLGAPVQRELQSRSAYQSSTTLSARSPRCSIICFA